MKPLLVLACLLLGACASSSKSLERMLIDQRADAEAAPRTDEARQELAARFQQRAARVHKLLHETELTHARDFVNAAAILVFTQDVDELDLARELALEGAERGDERGFRVAAEAIDRRCVQEHKPQRYGTQYLWEPVLSSWRLYPVDPATSDEERKAMGVPSLKDLEAAVKEFDAEMKARRKRR